MTNPIDLLLDWASNLWDSPGEAQRVLASPNPVQMASSAVGAPVSQQAFTQAIQASAPVSFAGGGNAEVGMQRLAQHHNLDYQPQALFAPQKHVDVASHNDIASPRAGEDVQQGVGNVDLDFDFSRDINASEGSVVNQGTIGGDVEATSVKGNQNAVDSPGANTGNVSAGQGSNVQAGGVGNDLDDRSEDVNVISGGDTAVGTGSGQVTQVGDIDTSGGNAAGGAGGGGLIGVGNDGGNAAGGAGGQVVIAPTQTTTETTTVGGSQSNTNIGGDVTGSNIDASADQDNDVTTTTVNDNDTTINDNDVTQNVDVNQGIELF